MKTIILILLAICFSGKDIHAQNAWYHQQSNVNTSLLSICFTDINNGWIAGDSGVILHTSNGGTDWIRQVSNTDKLLTQIVFTDSLNGIAGGSYYEYNPWGFYQVVLLSTTNGGNNWVVISDGYGSQLAKFEENAGTIYSAFFGFTDFGTTGSVAKTLNNGTNWIGLEGGEYGYNSVSFIDSLTGWALGEKGTDYGFRAQNVIKTTNAGESWDIVRSDTIIYEKGYLMEFVNDLVGYMKVNSLKKTTDGGYNWFSTDSIMTNNLRSHTFINTDTGWCIGSGGKVIRTNDGGNSWTIQTSNTGNLLNDIIFVNNETGYIVGTQGRILKTITGGLTGVTSFENQIPGSHILYQNYPNPFNPKTIINYELGIRNFVSLKIYDVLGNEVAELVNEKQNAGSYSVEFDGSGIASGVYFYRLETNNFSEIKKMIFIK